MRASGLYAPEAQEARSPVLGTLCQDLASFFRLTPEGVADGLRNGTDRLARLWNEAMPRTPAEEAAWYRRDDVSRESIFDLANWHLGAAGALIPVILGGITAQKCLDYGAGIGTWTLELVEQGNTVDYVEPAELAARFILYRQVRGPSRYTKMAQRRPPQGQYDVIICWHVLEHLPEPQDTATYLATLLGPGGRVITQSDFYRGEAHPMHHVLPPGATVDQLWAQAGLKQTFPWQWQRDER